MSFIVTNKWLKSGYGGPLRKLLGEKCWVESLVDFGHAKQIFPDADVFPCILTAQKPGAGVAPETARVCTIPRELLRIEDLSRQITDAGVQVPRVRLGAAPWSLEPPAVDDLLVKLRRVGIPLKDFAGARPLFGIKTGLNEAFLMDQAARDGLVAADPKSAEILRPYVRGQDIDRWKTRSAGLWMLAIKSSENHGWPWSKAGDGAEQVFCETYPAVYAHLNGYRDTLQKRQDKGRFWWELRSCAYWAKFDQPKIFYQDIAWQPEISFDAQGMLANNSVYFLPSGDLWTLAVLNSPVGWWFAWRKAQHGKDEALRYMTEFMEAFPIPRPSGEQREEGEGCVRELLRVADVQQAGAHDVLDWLRVEFGVDKPSQKLENLLAIDEDMLLAEVKKARGRSKPLGVSDVSRLRAEHKRSIMPLQGRLADILRLERQVSGLVNAAYGLTTEEVALMWETAPPRMPIKP